MWTDSQCVLKQIADRKTRFKQFFENRLSKIHAATTVDQWGFIESGKNPAHWAATGIHANEKEKWLFFHRGPQFLWEPEDQWPKYEVTTQANNVVDIAATTVETLAGTSAGNDATDHVLETIDWISSYERKLKRIAALKTIVAFWRQYKRPRHNTRSSKNRPVVGLEIVHRRIIARRHAQGCTTNICWVHSPRWPRILSYVYVWWFWPLLVSPVGLVGLVKYHRAPRYNTS